MLAIWGSNNGVITSQSITIWGHEETDLESSQVRLRSSEVEGRFWPQLQPAFHWVACNHDLEDMRLSIKALSESMFVLGMFSSKSES